MTRDTIITARERHDAAKEAFDREPSDETQEECSAAFSALRKACDAHPDYRPSGLTLTEFALRHEIGLLREHPQQAEDEVARLREGLEQYDEAVLACPIRAHKADGQAPCPRCRAGPEHNCGLDVAASDNFIRRARTLLNGDER